VTARLLVFVALLLPAAAAAAPLTRRRALDLALRGNPQIAAARADVEAVVAQKRQAKALAFPIITLDVGLGPAQQATLVPGSGIQSTETSFSLNALSVFFRGDLEIIQPLYTFGKISNRKAAAEHGIRARQAQVEMTRADVALEVARLYESFLYARDAQRLFEEIEHILDGSIGTTKDHMKQQKGNVDEQDLLRLQTTRALAGYGLDHAVAGARAAQAGLAAYLGIALADALPGEDTLVPIAVTLSAEPRLVDTALGHRPELVALREGSAAYDRLAAAERAAYWPDFFLLGLLSAAYTPGRDFINTRYYADPLYHLVPALVVGLHWTLQADTPGRRADEVRAAAHRLQATQSWAVAGIPAEVRSAFEDVTRARKDIDEGEPGVERAKQWLVRASADYDMGLGESRSVADAAQGYVLVRTGLLEARWRWNVGLAELAKAMGGLADGTGPYPGEGNQ
jgi:outer membrane protein TolC